LRHSIQIAAADLDAAFPERPVWLERIDGHAGWANTAAMRRVGRDLGGDWQPDGGQILRDGTKLAGVFVDKAADLVNGVVPVPDEAFRAEALRRALAATASVGLTGVHDMGTSAADLALYGRFADEGRLTLRVVAYADGDSAALEERCRSGAYLHPSGRVRMAGVKFYADGALGSRGAALLEPYSDDHGNRGLLVTPPEQLLEGMRKAQRCGLQVATHAIGDRGNRLVLDGYAQALGKDAAGDHRVPQAGSGSERLSETRPYLFGDAINEIDSITTLGNAIRRGGLEDISIEEDDLEVYETEHLSSCATVLLLDVSHSMVLYGEDRITPAKRVALALTELITTRYPKDELSVVLFGDDALPVSLRDLPYVGAGPYHTNTKAGLRLAQQILARRRHANKQIVMITDGKPSCIFEGGRLYKNPFGLDPKIVNRTLDEAVACRRKGIRVTTFMVADDPHLRGFVERFTQLNRGRAYYSDLENLGAFVLVDFVKNRRKRVR